MGTVNKSFPNSSSPHSSPLSVLPGGREVRAAPVAPATRPRSLARRRAALAGRAEAAAVFTTRAGAGTRRAGPGAPASAPPPMCPQPPPPMEVMEGPLNLVSAGSGGEGLGARRVSRCRRCSRRSDSGERVTPLGSYPRVTGGRGAT